MTTGQLSCPHQTNLRSLADLDPYPAYRSAAEKAPVHWDHSMGGWVVFGFDACSAVLKDEPDFVMPWTALEGGQEALGRYGIFNLTGEAQARAHKELLDFFNPRKSPHLQATVERLVEDSFARVKELGQVDFINAVARRVPGLMALAFLGVPQDEDLLETVHDANTKLQNYMQSFGDDPQALAELQAAQDRLAELWGPSIEARRQRREPDLISRLLDQQESLADWAPRELISQCLFYFGASFGNTANAIANAAYMLAVAASSLVISGRARQVRVMWQNSRCSILFHFRRAGREVAHRDLQPGLLRQDGELVLPEPARQLLEPPASQTTSSRRAPG